MLDELKEKMEGENIPKGIHKICYENHLVYAHISLDSQIGLQTVSSKSIAKDLSFIIYIENYCHHRRFLIWWKITKLLIHVHSLTYLLSPRQAHSDNIYWRRLYNGWGNNIVRSIHHITPKKLQINVLWLIYVRKGLDNNILKV